MDTREVSKAGDALFKLDGKPTARQAFPLALQHVVAMVVGCVTPAIIIGGIAQRKGEISQADITVLVQSALLIAGISTLIQLISFKYTMGSGLSVIIGVSFAYLCACRELRSSLTWQPCLEPSWQAPWLPYWWGYLLRGSDSCFRLPTATFIQNVGIVATTKVVAKRVFYDSGLRAWRGRRSAYSHP